MYAWKNDEKTGEQIPFDAAQVLETRRKVRGQDFAPEELRGGQVDLALVAGGVGAEALVRAPRLVAAAPRQWPPESGEQVVEVDAALGGHREVQHEDGRDEGEDDGRLVAPDVGELVDGGAGQNLDAPDHGWSQGQDDQDEQKTYKSVHRWE